MPTQLMMRVAQSAGILVDLVILVDATSSMGPFIDAVKRGLIHLLGILESGNLDVRLGLVVFWDELCGERPECYPVGTPVDEIRKILQAKSVRGGGDIQESSLLAIKRGLELKGFRNSAKVVFVVDSDAPPHDPESGVSSSNILKMLKDRDVLCFACTPNIEPYRSFANSTQGTLFEITPGMDSNAFLHVVKSFGHATVKTVHAMRGADARKAMETAMRLTRRYGE